MVNEKNPCDWLVYEGWEKKKYIKECGTYLYLVIMTSITSLFPVYNMRQTTVTNLAEENVDHVWIDPINMNNLNTQNEIRFEYTVPPGGLLDISSINFETSVKMKKKTAAAGNALENFHAEGANLYVEPNFFHNQFKNIRVYIEVKDLGLAIDDGFLHHYAYMDNVLNLNNESHNLQRLLVNEGFYNITSKVSMNQPEHKLHGNGAATNAQFRLKRMMVAYKDICDNDTDYNQFRGKLKHWFFTINSCLPQLLKLTVILYKNTNHNILVTYSSDAYNVGNGAGNTVIEHGVGLDYQHIKMGFNVRYLANVPIPSMGGIAPFKTLMDPFYDQDPNSRQLVKYSFLRPRAYSFEISGNVREFATIIALTRYPKEVWLAVQDRDMTIGCKDKSSFLYSHQNITQLYIEKNGKRKYPRNYESEEGLKLNWAESKLNLSRCYNEMYENMRVGTDNDFYKSVYTPCITLKDFINAEEAAFKNIFRIDMTDVNEISEKRGLVPAVQGGNMKIYLRTTMDLNNKQLIMFLFFDDFLEYDVNNISGMTQSW